MPFCNKCGSEIAENINLCPKCGDNQQAGQNPAQSTGDKPTLWGPVAACILSIFLPPLGVFLHYSNWKTLKQESKAKTSLIWFICLIVFFPVSLLILIVWYITSAREQVIYIKEKYGAKKKKKPLLIPIVIVIAIVLVVLVLPAIAIPKLFGMTPKAKAMEVVPTAGTWSKLQQAYIMEFGKVGNCSQIGYTPPGNGKSTVFTYECGVLQNGNAYWSAKNHVDLGECKAGNNWALTMNKNMEAKVKQPDDKNCQMLTPSFGNIR
jgi:membrane protease YdiL (CAAX protease family)